MPKQEDKFEIQVDPVVVLELTEQELEQVQRELRRTKAALSQQISENHELKQALDAKSKSANGVKVDA